MTRSAALSSSPSQAGPSGSYLERETPGERQPTVTTTLAPSNGLLAEATSNSRVVSTPRQPLASVYYLTKAGTQTKSQSHRSGLLIPPETDLYLVRFACTRTSQRVFIPRFRVRDNFWPGPSARGYILHGLKHER
jgi:hypothetical protein